jgi:hypothetical protein
MLLRVVLVLATINVNVIVNHNENDNSNRNINNIYFLLTVLVWRYATVRRPAKSIEDEARDVYYEFENSNLSAI